MIVTKLRQKMPEMKILLLDMFFRDENPNEQGCRVWAEASEPKVAVLLGDTPVTP